MSCNNSCNNTQVNTSTQPIENRQSCSRVIIVVLYILLAIIIGSCLY